MTRFLIAGLAGEVAFEAWAFGLNPLLFGFALEPAYLVQALAGQWAGLELSYAVAFALHVFAGAVLFPLGCLGVMRIGAPRPAVVDGVLWGLVLWVLAQGVLAPLVGRPFFLGFGAYTWASLIAHPLFMVVFAVVRRALP